MSEVGRYSGLCSPKHMLHSTKELNPAHRIDEPPGWSCMQVIACLQWPLFRVFLIGTTDFHSFPRLSDKKISSNKNPSSNVAECGHWLFLEGRRPELLISPPNSRRQMSCHFFSPPPCRCIQRRKFPILRI